MAFFRRQGAPSYAISLYYALAEVCCSLNTFLVVYLNKLWYVCSGHKYWTIRLLKMTNVSYVTQGQQAVIDWNSWVSWTEHGPVGVSGSRLRSQMPGQYWRNILDLWIWLRLYVFTLASPGIIVLCQMVVRTVCYECALVTTEYGRYKICTVLEDDDFFSMKLNKFVYNAGWLKTVVVGNFTVVKYKFTVKWSKIPWRWRTWGLCPEPLGANSAPRDSVQGQLCKRGGKRREWKGRHVCSADRLLR